MARIAQTLALEPDTTAEQVASFLRGKVYEFHIGIDFRGKLDHVTFRNRAGEKSHIASRGEFLWWKYKKRIVIL